jgi:integrase
MTDKGVAALKPRAKRYSKPDSELRGHWVRVQPSGAKSFWAVTRNPDGKQVWTFIGPADAMSIEAAREKARSILTRVRAGLPAIEQKGETFGTVFDSWMKRHVEKNGLRSYRKITNLSNLHFSDKFRAREITTIRRSEIVALLDHIEDDHGAPQADAVLTIISSVMHWHATRHDDYVPPLVRGMRRVDTKKQQRDRVLNDDELRAIWTTAEANGTYGALIRFLLLTAQRLDKALTMKWTDISPVKWPSNEPPVWTIPTAPREKGNIGAVQLPQAALDILDTLPRYAANPRVFAGRSADGHIASSGLTKRRFDAKLPVKVAHFTLHDLRRTARSLMSRAKVSREDAERVLGHAVGGVEETYDRYRYQPEKTEALAKLAALIDSIVHPRANVLPMKRGKRQ